MVCSWRYGPESIQVLQGSRRQLWRLLPAGPGRGDAADDTAHPGREAKPPLDLARFLAGALNN